jgi:alpha-D-ribose 1-methylphosphonate 5-triphosphate synthase subunit PhnH
MGNWLRRARPEKVPKVTSQSKFRSVLDCLQQPGQLSNQLHKSLRLELFPLIGTQSSGQLYCDTEILPTYRSR